MTMEINLVPWTMVMYHLQNRRTCSVTSNRGGEGIDCCTSTLQQPSKFVLTPLGLKWRGINASNSHCTHGLRRSRIVKRTVSPVVI